MEKIVFWGTGDSMGVPRVYCDCLICHESRTTGQNRRYRSSVLLKNGELDLLIDCGPDWSVQMNLFRKRDQTHILITHAHFDHIGGLPEWSDACRWLEKKGHLYAPSEVIHSIQKHYPWINQHIQFHPIDGGFAFNDWRITPWKVNHGKNGYSFAYRFEKETFRWAYCPDSIHLPEEEKLPLQHLDLLILGTSFYQEPYNPKSRSVYDMIEAIALLQEVTPAMCVFTHMSHGVDITQSYPLPENVQLAYTSLEIPLHVRA